MTGLSPGHTHRRMQRDLCSAYLEEPQCSHQPANLILQGEHNRGLAALCGVAFAGLFAAFLVLAFDSLSLLQESRSTRVSYIPEVSMV